MGLSIIGSSLNFSAHGWWGKEKNLSAKNSVRPSKGMAEGCGVASPAPERSSVRGKLRERRLDGASVSLKEISRKV